jgi:O-antigen biosynthesis protein
MFSVITPTHDPAHLNDVYRSLCDQTTREKWEWIVAPNNGAKVSAFDDPRVRVIESNLPAELSKSIGALKREAFGHAGGEILVELDHDDMLTPDCLEELSTAFREPAVGFVYSNAVMLAANWQKFGEGRGWQYRTFDWHGQALTEVISFAPSAASLAFVWYAPDHVRAWRKSVYAELGGHDPARDILDDHELLIRTYLHTTMRHIDKALYLYRVSGRNTCVQTEINSRIQVETVQLFFRHAYQLAEREADLRGLMKIDLCGGLDKPPGYVSLDRHGGDITCDLDQGIPLDSHSVGVVRAHDAIEHLKNPITTMTEIHRVLADGGWAMISVPSTDGRGAFQDPTHVSYWNENSFWYWTRAQQARYIRNEAVKFQAFRLDTGFPSEWYRQSNIPYVTAHLRAVKSADRRPHLQWI